MKSTQFTDQPLFPATRSAVGAALLLLAAPAAMADITYPLQFDPASSHEAQQIANSVAVAAAFYHGYGSFKKNWNVYFNPVISAAATGIPVSWLGIRADMGILLFPTEVRSTKTPMLTYDATYDGTAISGSTLFNS